MDAYGNAAYALDDGMGFFKARELFGWSESEARAGAWRAALSLDRASLDSACAACKSLDFRHAPSGLSLLGLAMAVESGGDELDAPLLRTVLARGADPNFPIDAQGGLALIRCALDGRVDAALLLIDRGADLKARSAGAASLSELAQGGHRCAARILQLASAS